MTPLIPGQAESRPRICHVCSAHTDDDTRVFHRMCVGLADAGYDVHLVAGSESSAVRQVEGVTIHPLPVARTRRERFARRAEVARRAAALNADLYHVHEPDILGAVLSHVSRSPVVYDVHESYLDVLREGSWIPRQLRPLVVRAWDWQERRLSGRCAGVVCVTEQIASRYRGFSQRVRIVANFPEISDWMSLVAPERDGLTCVHAGTLDDKRGVLEIVSALALLRQRGLTIPLLLAGWVSSNTFLTHLWEHAKQLGVRDQIEYYGVLSREETIALQNRSSIGLVCYQPIRNNVVGLPNKLLECMGLGLPVVFSDFPNYRTIAGETGAGIAVDPTRPEQIADAVEQLVRQPERARRMGETGRRVVCEQFNWDIELSRLFCLYDEILGNRMAPLTEDHPAPSEREPVLQR